MKDKKDIKSESLKHANKTHFNEVSHLYLLYTGIIVTFGGFGMNSGVASGQLGESELLPSYAFILIGIGFITFFGWSYYNTYNKHKKTLLKINQVEFNEKLNRPKPPPPPSETVRNIKRLYTHKKFHLCSLCKSEFTSMRSVDELAGLIVVCVNCVTVCKKEIEHCHSCGTKFLEFNESADKIFSEQSMSIESF